MRWAWIRAPSVGCSAKGEALLLGSAFSRYWPTRPTSPAFVRCCRPDLRSDLADATRAAGA